MGREQDKIEMWRDMVTPLFLHANGKPGKHFNNKIHCPLFKEHRSGNTTVHKSEMSWYFSKKGTSGGETKW